MCITSEEEKEEEEEEEGACEKRCYLFASLGWKTQFDSGVAPAFSPNPPQHKRYNTARPTRLSTASTFPNRLHRGVKRRSLNFLVLRHRRVNVPVVNYSHQRG